MPIVDYWAVREGAQRTIAKHVPALRVEVERELIFDPEECPYAIVYLESREARDEDQRISAGTSTWFVLTINVMVGGFGMTLEEAVRERDRNVGDVEVALMRDRTLDGKGFGARLLGGDMFDMRDDAGFLTWAEVRFEVDVQGTTT